jgi:Fic family protein
MYNWQRDSWPQFEFDTTSIEPQIFSFMQKSGELSGKLAALPEENRTEMMIQLLVSEALKTSVIEGEQYSELDVVSSVRRNLGLASPHLPKNKNVIGLSEMLVDVRNSYDEPLTEERLKLWHTKLLGNTTHIHAGEWRTDDAPMQIVSGSVARPKVHYEAPPSSRVPHEMKQFLIWYNESPWMAPPVKAAVAHLYFEAIHPFEDGNGRIGRAIVEKALSQGLQCPLPFSISKAIEANKKTYYHALQQAEKGPDITEWVKWFVQILLEAQTLADKMIQFTISKWHFFALFEHQLNVRQNKVINRMLAAGPDSFQGGMNVRKYVGITGASRATATRDLQALVSMQVFKPVGAGRSARYELVF